MIDQRAHLSNIWAQRALIWQFTLRNVELRHKGSHLGMFWSFANPLLLLGVYVFVFRFVFGGQYGVIPNETRWDYAFGLFVSLTVFQFLTEIISVSPMIIIGNPNFVKRVVFPLDVLPVSTVGSAAFHALVTMTLALIGVAILGPGVCVTWLWLPAIWIPILLLGAGFAWLISALGVFFRDLSQVTQFASTLLMFASAIFYPASKIPPAVWAFLRFNPVIHAVELTRGVVVWHLAPSLPHLLYLNGCGIVMLIVGFKIFHRLRPGFADVL